MTSPVTKALLGALADYTLLLEGGVQDAFHVL